MVGQPRPLCRRLRVVACRFGLGLVACSGLRCCPWAAAGTRFKPSRRSGLASLRQVPADWSLTDDERAEGPFFKHRLTFANERIGDAIFVERARDHTTRIGDGEIALPVRLQFERFASPAASGRR